MAQTKADVDEPGIDDLYQLGTLATILQLLKLPDGTVKVLVEGGDRVTIDEYHDNEFFSASITALIEKEDYDEREMDVLNLLGEGLVKKQIAAQLDIGYTTVDTHVGNIYEKLGVKNAPAAINQAHRRGLFDLSE